MTAGGGSEGRGGGGTACWPDISDGNSVKARAMERSSMMAFSFCQTEDLERIFIAAAAKFDRVAEGLGHAIGCTGILEVEDIFYVVGAMDDER